MPDPELQQLAALLQRGAHSELERRLADRLARDPVDAEAHRLLAMVASATGRADMALEHMARAVTLAPHVHGFQFQLGCLLAHAGRYPDALERFKATTSACPDMAEAWYFQGISLLRMHRDLEALPALRRAHSLAPDDLQMLDALAELEFRVGFPADALPLWRRLAKRRPHDVHTVLKRGECESRMGLFEDAIEIYRHALRTHPDSAALWMALAQAQEDHGDRAGALEAYRQTLGLRPAWAPPLAGLLALERGNSLPQQLHDAAQVVASTAGSDADRSLLGYALGRAYDAMGRHADAWDCWTIANQARQRMAGPANPGVLQSQVRQTIGAFSGADASRHASSEVEDDRFVFIVGMPRSGTTLTEQIIGAHPQAHPCGERPDLALIVRHLPLQFAPESPPWPQLAASLSQAQLIECGALYASGAPARATPGTARLLDKEPLNFQHLGLIQMLFPRARIIWCRRDPRDVAVSIFSENFAPGETLATSLEGIGHYINLQDRLMRHWMATSRLPIHLMQYETLVSAPEQEARRVIEFLDLDWDSACLEFHASRAGVQTPSRWQVKQPVHARSVGRWHNYGQHLTPLLDVLEPSSY